MDTPILDMYRDKHPNWVEVVQRFLWAIENGEYEVFNGICAELSVSDPSYWRAFALTLATFETKKQLGLVRCTQCNQQYCDCCGPLRMPK